MAGFMNLKSAAERAQHEERKYLDRVRPHDWKNPEPQALYDLAILGAGPAGIEAAETAARAGFRVALIERNGWAAIRSMPARSPSKAVIRTANVYAQMHDADSFGAPMPTEPAVDFANVMARDARDPGRASPNITPPGALPPLGVDLFFGEAHFAARNEIAAAGARIVFRKALIATGARPRPLQHPRARQGGVSYQRFHFRHDGISKAHCRDRRRTAGLRAGAGVAAAGAAGHHRAE